MNKIITFTCITLFCLSSILAQDKKESREKIKALKISYLTEQLGLTSKEAQKFWPIYNNHDNETNLFIRKKIEEIKKEISLAGSIDSLNEKRAEFIYSTIRSLDKKKFEEKEKYISELKKIISIKKILKLHIAEREFGRKLMRKYKHKRRN